VLLTPHALSARADSVSLKFFNCVSLSLITTTDFGHSSISAGSCETVIIGLPQFLHLSNFCGVFTLDISFPNSVVPSGTVEMFHSFLFGGDDLLFLEFFNLLSLCELLGDDSSPLDVNDGPSCGSVLFNEHLSDVW